MNVTAAIRAADVATTAGRGAVSTDYDQIPATAAQPFDAYRALHRGGRVHYNPRRATWILSRLEDVRAALRDTDQVTSTEGVTRLRFSAPLAVLADGEEHPTAQAGSTRIQQGSHEHMAGNDPEARRGTRVGPLGQPRLRCRAAVRDTDASTPDRPNPRSTRMRRQRLPAMVGKRRGHDGIDPHPTGLAGAGSPWPP